MAGKMFLLMMRKDLAKKDCIEQTFKAWIKQIKLLQLCGPEENFNLFMDGFTISMCP